MRGLIFQGNCKVEVLNFDDPTPGPGEAVIEMKASGMCGTDLHYYRHGMAASPAPQAGTSIDRFERESTV